MPWSEIIELLDTEGIVEFGIHQMDLRSMSPKWRRHKGGAQTRFRSLRSALFSPDKGARAACLGKSAYARKVYATGRNAIVPYVATWLRSSGKAFLVRASAGAPEVTIVPAADLEKIEGSSDGSILEFLGELFGQGAKFHGVRLLESNKIVIP